MVTLWQCANVWAKVVHLWSDTSCFKHLLPRLRLWVQTKIKPEMRTLLRLKMISLRGLPQTKCAFIVLVVVLWRVCMAMQCVRDLCSWVFCRNPAYVLFLICHAWQKSFQGIFWRVISLNIHIPFFSLGSWSFYDFRLDDCWVMKHILKGTLSIYCCTLRLTHSNLPLFNASLLFNFLCLRAQAKLAPADISVTSSGFSQVV